MIHFCKINTVFSNAFISSHGFTYKRALELAEKFYADMNKNKCFKVR